MKIYVVGTGGVGGYFGGMLAKAGIDVTFVARGEHYQAIKENGLTIDSQDGTFSIKTAKVIETISKITNPELILFTVKTYDTFKVARQLKTVVNENTIIITFQNGVNNDIEIKKEMKNAQVYPGVAYIISTRVKPGIIKQSGGKRWLIFGDRNSNKNLRLKEIEKIMLDAGIDATYSDDITRDLWKKFMFIVAFSGMTAICRSPIGRVLSDPLKKMLYERCAKEAIAVAKAMNVSIAKDAFETMMKTTIESSPDSKSSLLVDIENGREIEIETLNGTLIRFAAERKIDVPINQMIYIVVKSTVQ